MSRREELALEIARLRRKYDGEIEVCPRCYEWTDVLEPCCETTSQLEEIWELENELEDLGNE